MGGIVVGRVQAVVVVGGRLRVEGWWVGSKMVVMVGSKID